MAAGESAARASSPQPSGANTKNTDAGSITINNFAFTPKSIRVRAGQRVSWLNHDDEAHRIVSAQGSFAPSPVLDSKATYAVTLAAKGTYPYFCSLHPTMTGQIIVE
jgi:plastocyanin